MLSHCMRISVTECYFHANYTWLVSLVDFRVLVCEPSNSLALEPYNCRELVGSKGTWRREAACSVSAPWCVQVLRDEVSCPEEYGEWWVALEAELKKCQRKIDCPRHMTLGHTISGPLKILALDRSFLLQWLGLCPLSQSPFPSLYHLTLVLKMTYQAIVFMNFPSSILPVTLIIKYFLVHCS